MRNKISLKDIAKAVGVSTALVSYVLNNREREARVSPETAKKIREAAKELNYQPNQLAKSLKSGKSLAIGLILADISNPFFGHLARTIEDESKKKGYTVIVGSSDENYKNSERLMNTFIERQIDGFIIAPAEGSEAQLKYLNELNIPFVLIDRYFKEIESSYVVIDNFRATHDATAKLLELGHQNVAFVCYNNQLQHTIDRYNGYSKAMEEAGKKVTSKLLCKVKFNNPGDFHLKFRNLMTKGNKIDAVLFSTNTLSTLGLKTLMDLGIKIPDEVAVFCFDESESYDLFYCPVSYVSQPLKEIGQRAVQILVEMIGAKSGFHRQVILNSELVIRESCEKR
ncbi:MAG: LacI family DNA-binding transcriptional regulator [Chitinophagaceae bacterium]|nr:LacI family DNA-binding transcriptional regulator [Chitinophagaceae bacterium]